MRNNVKIRYAAKNFLEGRGAVGGDLESSNRPPTCNTRVRPRICTKRMRRMSTILPDLPFGPNVAYSISH